MVKSVKLDLKNGYYEIVKGTDFMVKSDGVPQLVYDEDGVWYVASDPDGGRSGSVQIEIPNGMEFKSFFVVGKDVAIRCDEIISENVYIDIKDGIGEFADISCKKIGIAMGKGNTRAKITDFSSLKIDCGYGTVDAHLPHSKEEYCIKSNCGMGKVAINSKALPKQYEKKTDGRKIDIRCGIGNVNIDTYLR